VSPRQTLGDFLGRMVQCVLGGQGHQTQDVRWRRDETCRGVREGRRQSQSCVEVPSRGRRAASMLLLKLPTHKEADREHSFQVLKNYMCASAYCVEQTHGSLDPGSLLSVQRSLPAYRRIQRRALTDEGALRQALILSWASRLQLGLASWIDQDDVIAYANAWSPVHAYYCVYGAVRAWSVAQGQPLNDHAAALRTISQAAAERGTLPVPWSVACVGSPHVDEPVGFTGLPPGVAFDNRVQLLGNADPALAWLRFLKLLETTRKAALDLRYKDWCRQHERKNTFAHEKQDIAKRLVPTTVFDVFWRLRVRANYRDAESFVMVMGVPQWHRQFHDALLCLTDLTTLLVENLVVQQVGLGAYEKIAEDFLRCHAPGGPTDFLATRVAALRIRSQG